VVRVHGWELIKNEPLYKLLHINVMEYIMVNIMKYSSAEAVKRWRKNTKRRIIMSMGGSCCICGYSKCDEALALHHLDPTKKELSFGAIRANPINWLNIVQELKKCILVCHVCHSEIHAGVTNVPLNYPLFDDAYTDYKNLENIDTQHPCPVCEKLTNSTTITCSRECGAKRKNKIDWDNIDLKCEMEQLSFVKIGEKYGISDMAVRKRAKKLGLK
jgi:hypothetical protein